MTNHLQFLVVVALACLLLPDLSAAQYETEFEDGLTGDTVEVFPDIVAWTVANGNGPLDPPVSAMADFAGFPVPSSPDESQQVGEGKWLIHVRDFYHGSDYISFLDDITTYSKRKSILPYDYEIRFTAEGGTAGSLYDGGRIFHVPFELWQIGIDTPDDPSDDVRMIPYIHDLDQNQAFNLITTTGIGKHPYWNATSADHTVDEGNNDPQSDIIFFVMPADVSPGDAGYEAWREAAESKGFAYADSLFYGRDGLQAVVLVNLNGGDVDVGLYNQDLPEVGTIFRITTGEIRHEVYPQHNVGNLILTLPPKAACFGNTDRCPPGWTGNWRGNGTWPADSEDTYIMLGTPFIVLPDGGVLNTLWGARHFRPDPGTQPSVAAGLSDQDITLQFSERPARDMTMHGLKLTQRSYQWSDPVAKDFIILAYDLKNPDDGEKLWDVSFGMFMDIDISWPWWDDESFFDPDLGLMYVFDQDPRTGYFGLAFVGESVLKEAWPRSFGFYGTRNVTNDMMDGYGGPYMDGSGTFGPSDIMAIFTEEAFNLEPGETHTVAYALIMGERLENVKASLQVARSRYAGITVDAESEEVEAIPTEFAVHQNFPNPFSRTTTIPFDVPEPRAISLSVFNQLGQEVRAIELGMQTPGHHEVAFDASNLASGLYFLRLGAGEFEASRRFVVLK